MSKHTAVVEWQRADGEAFVDRRYHRSHWLCFDGGADVLASSSPATVPLDSDPAGVDPEEMFVASLSSCHMLWFLDLAARAGWRVDQYVDEAYGTLARDTDGRMSMTEVVLRPRVTIGGDKRPTIPELLALHERAHAECFIANSVKTHVRCEPRP